MNIVHIFTVNPMPTAVNALPRVEKCNYFLMAGDIHSAFALIRENVDVLGAAEVYARLVGSGAREVAGPRTLMTQHLPAQDHAYWTKSQTTYTLVAAGPVPIKAYFQREYAERYPDRD